MSKGVAPGSTNQRADCNDNPESTAPTKEERLRTLAWMADYGDEVGAPLRFFDTKDHDISSATAVIARFVHRVDALFIESKPWRVSGTYSHYIDHLLRKATLLQKSTGMTSLGGNSITCNMQARLAQRCAACIRLALQQLDLEFPYRDVVLAFQCFSLSPPLELSECREPLRRLSRAFGLDTEAVKSQFTDFRFFAIAAYDQLHVKDTLAAWKQSVQRQSQQARQVKAHPSMELQQLLIRFGAFRGELEASCSEIYKQPSS
jgi:hypothetical protein